MKDDLLDRVFTMFVVGVILKGLYAVVMFNLLLYRLIIGF